MSEYQYYKFERLDGYLDAKARQALRSISSRAEISATSFQVYYTYSDLKAEPSELILKYFDIGFYYADWGSIDAYIKLPAGTLPEALLGFSSDGLHVHENDEWQLLIFSLEEYDEYFDDEHADDFFQYLAGLRCGLMQGDWRLVYFMWLKAFDFNDDVEQMPLIQFDFEHLSEELQAFAALYDIPLALVKALAMVLSEQPSHQAKQTQLTLDAWLHNLSEAEKDTLLRTLFEQGQLTRHQALALTRKEPANTDEIYQYWLTPAVISPFIEQAQSQLQQEQAAALAKKLAIEKAEKEKALTDIYNQREHYWQQSQEQADRTCASGYDAASRYLHQLFDAYQFKADEAAFEQRFKRFVVANNSRKALLNRLSDLLKR
ncbi:MULTISPECIES: hypothetical protein [Gammaproteobacteria]|uniref:Uncharacterized protein n=1 Tax=Vibrio diazotrophicus TaxID=685 RepID=A0A329EAY1_VIBDI|nr:MULTISPECIES: hypothetical protein [Vibrio]MBY8152123.1 hypothetical protein [Vibrio fluvialis]EIV0336008.1 hypothetical protein [Vibrio cholerae]MDN4713014.1 hypothetical protein [Vibrio parahaemolyticus]MDN4722368.1 hypothetical protein [Vibrio parahaemolyticus]MDN4730306.1 hypothetical protein [Vibrio parahaemolyticus]